MKAKPITSLKDAGYRSALAGEGLTQVAQYIIEQCPMFLTEVPDEVKAELTAGWALRWQELNTAKQYSVDWVPVEKDGAVTLTLAYAMSFTAQAFGQLRQSDPQRHAVIKQVRDAFSKYCSNRMADLKTAIKRLTATDRQRSATPDFADWVNTALDNILTRCKNASARGDATANEVKVRMAIESFKKTLG